MIDVIEPDSLRQRRMQHGRVVGLIERAKSRRERAHSSIAVHFEFQNLDSQRVARLRPFDKKRPGQRIVALHHAELVPRLLDRVAKAVKRVGVKNVARLQMRDRFRRSEQVLHVGVGRGVVNDVLSGQGTGHQHKNKKTSDHGDLLVNCQL